MEENSKKEERITQEYINKWSEDLYSDEKRKKIKSLSKMNFLISNLQNEKILISKDFLNMLLDLAEIEDKDVLLVYFRSLCEYIDYLKKKDEIPKILPIIEKLCCVDINEVREKV